MGHGKLKKFSENETFTCLLQPDSSEILAGKEQGAAFSHSPLVLKDHPVKGRWNEEMFGGRDCPIVLELGCGKGEYPNGICQRRPHAGRKSGRAQNQPFQYVRSGRFPFGGQDFR